MQGKNKAQRAVDHDLGRAVRELRHRRGLTQEALALESGLQRKTVHQIEHSKSDPRLGTLQRLAGAVGLHPAELLAPAADDDATRTGGSDA
jgi:transcriptional regulator with XRE-family HTH domain